MASELSGAADGSVRSVAERAIGTASRDESRLDQEQENREVSEAASD